MAVKVNSPAKCKVQYVYKVITIEDGNLLGCDAVCLRRVVLHVGKGCTAFTGNNSPKYTAVGLQLQ